LRKPRAWGGVDEVAVVVAEQRTGTVETGHIEVIVAVVVVVANGDTS
jgi:hypothetical protein